MKKFRILAVDILSNSNSTLLLNLQLMNLWINIIGKDYEGYADFESAVYSGKNRVTVFLRILSSAALIMKYRKDNIIEKIKENIKIDEVELILKHTAELHLRKSPIIANSDKADFSKQSPMKLKNNNLKEALEKLQTEMQNAA